MRAAILKTFYLLVPIVIGLFSLNFVISDASSYNEELVQFEQTRLTLEAMAQVDELRKNETDKIITIVNRFNKTMPLNMKHAIASEIVDMSVKYPNLNIPLICATITHESGRSWDPEVVSLAGAMGLMQIMPRTGRWLAKYESIDWSSKKEILFDPILNIRMGTRYLSALIETYDLEGGLAAYNGGGKRAKMWLANDKAEGILWAETRSYIPHVLKLYHEFSSASL